MFTLIRLGAVASLTVVAQAWNNGLALTPPMGFANWNLFGCNYNDALFREMADAMVSSGLASLGFEYMLVQECIVPAGARDPVTHVVQPDTTKFPHGLADLAQYFHSKGLKAGIYTDVFSLTCANYEGSGASATNPAGHWPLDALTYAQWGYDLIEADFCNGGGVNLTAFQAYTVARDAIAAATAATGRPIVFYACNWGEQQPWNWAPQVANLFRATGDICGPGSINWNRILSNFDNTIVHSPTASSTPGEPGTGIGAWLDPDMIGVGLPGITDVEGRSQFSLWCILGAPLFLGTDVRNMTAATLETLSNAEVIAINQDPLAVQGMQVDVGPAPTVYQGGTLLNFTACSSSTSSSSSTMMMTPGTMWTFNATTGQISNANSSDCLAVYSCGNQENDWLFAYQCVTNQCGNEIFTWDATTGAIMTNVTPAPAQPLCIAGVDPSTGPDSQLILEVCDPTKPEQKWSMDPATGALSVTFASNPTTPMCLTEYVVGGMLFMKPLSPSLPPGGGGGGRESENLALAVLNRNAETLTGGYTIEFSWFSYAPAQQIMVRDIWANTTSGPYIGSYTTRDIASHETIMLRLWLV